VVHGDKVRGKQAATPEQRVLMIPKKMYRRSWSQRAMITMIVSVILSVLLSVGEGLVYELSLQSPKNTVLPAIHLMVNDFRFLFEQVMYASAILFVGSRFFEQRTLITIAFDRPDSEKMTVSGPDENGFIWIGRKYASRIEGETAVAALKSRIMQSSEKNVGEFGW
jgi:hypothetical protein